jgi:hypothetical protein
MMSFVQLELAGQIGLPDGRYLAREEEGEQTLERVLIAQTLGAPRAGRRRRRPQAVDPADPDPVPVTRVTVTSARQPAGPDEAKRWLDATARDAEAYGREVRSATLLVNRALNALRAEARDPLVQDIGATRALAIRIGYGTGDELADGRWTEARELPRPKRGRLEGVDPQTRVAAVLGGRDQVHPAETLIQRARLDERQGRLAEARYCLRAAKAALEDEPPPKKAELREQLDALEQRLADAD